MGIFFLEKEGIGGQIKREYEKLGGQNKVKHKRIGGKVKKLGKRWNSENEKPKLGGCAVMKS